jgi:serine/threonine protein kinase
MPRFFSALFFLLLLQLTLLNFSLPAPISEVRLASGTRLIGHGSHSLLHEISVNGKKFALKTARSRSRWFDVELKKLIRIRDLLSGWPTEGLVLPSPGFEVPAIVHKRNITAEGVVFPLFNLNLKRFFKVPRPARQRFDIALQVARAIQTLHGARIIHGDIKPENVVIREEAGQTVAALVDLESSWLEGERQCSIRTDRYTDRKAFKEKSRSYDSDVYSFAFVLRRIFTNHHNKRIFKLRNLCMNPDRHSRPHISTVVTELEAIMAEEFPDHAE